MAANRPSVRIWTGGSRAMKRYGLILADNGSPWYFSGTSDIRWSDEELNELKALRDRNFEVVDTSELRNG